ncbi:MAG TPA: hypothetical protein VLF67_00915 [Candidatus Saccharimonas sp.]|nr:hypothetical protein [Candidatus Saccharimonas sp.]
MTASLTDDGSGQTLSSVPLDKADVEQVLGFLKRAAQRSDQQDAQLAALRQRVDGLELEVAALRAGSAASAPPADDRELLERITRLVSAMTLAGVPQGAIDDAVNGLDGVDQLSQAALDDAMSNGVQQAQKGATHGQG